MRMPPSPLPWLIFALLSLADVAGGQPTTRPAEAASRPNLIVVAVDDLGYGDVGSFGQKMLKTPALDGMSAEGMRFTQFYAGGTTRDVSQAVMLTGRHGGRTAIPVRPAARGPTTVVSLLKQAGYTTATVGNWVGEGPDHPAKPDDALRFIREPKQSPFLLMWSPASTAGDLGEFANRDWPEPEKRFAARVRDLDRDVGRLLALLKELRLDRSTLVIFTSGNGPASEAGHSADFFDSNVRFRGGSGEILEGGIRAATIAWWPGTIAPATENDRQWYAGDLFATAAELAGVKLPDPADKPKPDPATLFDSDSFVPALRGQVNPDQWARRSRLYWDSEKGPTSQAVRFGKWKAIRSPMFTGPVELFDMSNDPTEKRDYAQRRPDLAKHATNLLNSSRPSDPNRPGAKP